MGRILQYSKYLELLRQGKRNGHRGGASMIGGLVGYFADNSITNSFATGNVTATSDSTSVGGLVGYFRNGPGGINIGIYNSYATGKVTGGSEVGGLAGSAGADPGDNSYIYISNSCSYGNVNGMSYVGGILGQDVSTRLVRR